MQENLRDRPGPVKSKRGRKSDGGWEKIGRVMLLYNAKGL